MTLKAELEDKAGNVTSIERAGAHRRRRTAIAEAPLPQQRR